jgi:hypothetical protein
MRINPSWPTNTKVNGLAYLQIKYQIMAGILTEEQDWRLNKRLSLIAASEFLNKIDGYWNTDRNKELLN